MYAPAINQIIRQQALISLSVIVFMSNIFVCIYEGFAACIKYCNNYSLCIGLCCFLCEVFFSWVGVAVSCMCLCSFCAVCCFFFWGGGCFCCCSSSCWFFFCFCFCFCFCLFFCRCGIFCFEKVSANIEGLIKDLIIGSKMIPLLIWTPYYFRV